MQAHPATELSRGPDGRDVGVPGPDNRARIDRLVAGGRLDTCELEDLLGSASSADREYARAAAAAVTHRHFGGAVYVRGLIEFSNHCRRDCLYCGIRKSNRSVERYRLDADAISARCVLGHELGFRTFVLQSGEDARYTADTLVDIVRRIRRDHPDCAITLSIGERGRETYQRLFDAGADRFLLRHETADAAHYARLHPQGQTLASRLRCLSDLKEIGYQVGAGFMVGSPLQTMRNIAQDLDLLADFRPHMAGVGPFLPHRATPFRSHPPGSADLTLFVLSLVRLLLPTVLLPATTALGSTGADAREAGILAGANVVMLNLTPQPVQAQYRLYDGKPVHGDVAAQTAALRRSLARIGHEVVVDRGDHPEGAR